MKMMNALCKKNIVHVCRLHYRQGVQGRGALVLSEMWVRM